MTEKRTIAADKWLETYAGEAFDPDGPYTLSRETLQQLLRTYGKEIVLEASERADTEYNEMSGENDKVDKTSILQIMDEL